MLENIHRILAPGGTYICVSRGPPETRLLYLQTIGWNVEVQKVQKRANGLAGGSLSGNAGMSEQQQSDMIFDRIDQEQYFYIYVCSKRF